MKLVQVKCIMCTLLNYVDVHLVHFDMGETNDFSHKCTYCGKSIDDELELALSKKDTFIIIVEGNKKQPN